MSAERDPGTIDTWKGVAIKKMGRGDLEREFILLATAERDRNVSFHGAGEQRTTGRISPPVVIDPQTARCLRELRDTIRQIEEGETALRRFCDETVDAGRLQRSVSLTAEFIPPAKAKT